MKEDEVVWECRKHGGEEENMQSFHEKTRKTEIAWKAWE
jgi:hypothetical protein